MPRDWAPAAYDRLPIPIPMTAWAGPCWGVAMCLGDHVEGMSDIDRRRFVHGIAGRMPEPVIDYVRLDIRARRTGARKHQGATGTE